MIDRALFEAALVGGVVVRGGFRRVAAIVSEESFRSSNNRVIYGFARDLALCGLDDDGYVLCVADAMRVAAISTKHLERALLAFCDVADARPDWKLEDLARRVRDADVEHDAEVPSEALVRRLEDLGVMIDLHGGARRPHPA